MIYVLLIPAIIFQVYIFIRLRKIQLHDKILYNFCQSRRDMMSYLRNKYDTINKEEYIEIKHVLGVTSNSIHYFNKHKITSFNLNAMANLIKKAKSEIRIVQFRSPINEDIEKFQYSLKYNYLKAILTYTPFIRAKITLYFIKLLTKMGIKTMKKVLRNIMWVDNECNNLHMTASIA